MSKRLRHTLTTQRKLLPTNLTLLEEAPTIDRLPLPDFTSDKPLVRGRADALLHAEPLLASTLVLGELGNGAGLFSGNGSRTRTRCFPVKHLRVLIFILRITFAS